MYIFIVIKYNDKLSVLYEYYPFLGIYILYRLMIKYPINEIMCRFH